jgi:hypothetical protein
MATPERQRQRRIARAGAVACLALALSLAGSHIAFLRTIQNNIVHADWCRFVQLIDDYHQGRLTVTAFLRPCNHFSILNPAIFIADGLLFQLDLRFYLYAPIVVLLAATYVSYRVFTQQPTLPERRHLLPICFVPLVILILSPMFYHTLSNGPACYNLTRTALYLIFFGYLSTTLSSGQLSERRTALLAVLMLSLTFVVGGAAAAAFTAATLVVCVHSYFTAATRHRPQIAFLALTALLALGGLIAAQFWLRKSSLSPSGLPYTPATLSLYVLNSLGNPLRLSSVPFLTQIAGALVLAAYVYGCSIYLRRRSPQFSYCPLLLLLHATFFIGLVSIRISRYGSDAGLASRYLPDQVLGLLGVAWILVTQALDTRESNNGATSLWIHRPLSLLRLTAATCLVLAIIICQAFAMRDAFSHATIVGRHYAALRNRMLESSQAPSISITPSPLAKQMLRESSPPSWEQAMTVLKHYRLNVFSEVAERSAANP